MGGTAPADASAPAGATASAYLPTAAKVPSVTHTTRLWTQVSGGRNGYADITHTYTYAGGGRYTGVMKGSLHHYYAPKNRQVVVVFRVDGKLGGWSRVTTGNTTFNKPYKRPYKKVSARVCLHRAGATIGLYSGVSYCSPWWG